MFYFPDVECEKMFLRRLLPLPKKLLPFLVDKGLNVMVLPNDEDKAAKLVYGLLRVKHEPFAPYDERYPHVTPHYRIESKTIVLPRWSLEFTDQNIAIHEIGHALDYLYYDGVRVVSDVPVMARSLRKVPPLDRYCLKTDSVKGNNVEQFATSFEAYFNEYEHRLHSRSELRHSIDELDESFVQLMNRHFVGPFMKGSDVQD